MAMDDKTKANIGFKRALGRAHTGPRELVNETVPSSFVLHATNIFAETISSSPAVAVSAGVAEQVTLELVLDTSSNGKAYFCKFSASHPTYSSQLLYESGVHLIPQSFSTSYRPILRKDGTEIPPLASEDWVIDCFAGIVTSEDNLNLGSGGTIDCYIYIGKTVQERLEEGGGGSGSSPTQKWVEQAGLTVISADTTFQTPEDFRSESLMVCRRGLLTAPSHEDGFTIVNSNTFTLKEPLNPLDENDFIMVSYVPSV